tara:strand:- start:414 stop:563 length:150 start_codon:yes stop_codon:yes gene_type:complete
VSTLIESCSVSTTGFGVGLGLYLSALNNIEHPEHNINNNKNLIIKILNN